MHTTSRPPCRCAAAIRCRRPHRLRVLTPPLLPPPGAPAVRLRLCRGAAGAAGLPAAGAGAAYRRRRAAARAHRAGADVSSLGRSGARRRSAAARAGLQRLLAAALLWRGRLHTAPARPHTQCGGSCNAMPMHTCHPCPRRSPPRACLCPATHMQIVGKVSSWIDADSQDASAAATSREALRQELAWAAFLGMQAVLLPRVREAPASFNTAGIVNQVRQRQGWWWDVPREPLQVAWHAASCCNASHSLQSPAEAHMAMHAPVLRACSEPLCCCLLLSSLLHAGAARPYAHGCLDPAAAGGAGASIPSSSRSSSRPGPAAGWQGRQQQPRRQRDRLVSVLVHTVCTLRAQHAAG